MMKSEIDSALNFVLNFLYNKLPRRRINLFGDELELALLDKFQNHWYPDQPYKGSAFRCLRITDVTDPVLNRATRESGNLISDIIENLPSDLAIWIDPGEVSYRIGEKGTVHILLSSRNQIGSRLTHATTAQQYENFMGSTQSGGNQPVFRPLYDMDSKLSTNLTQHSSSPYGFINDKPSNEVKAVNRNGPRPSPQGVTYTAGMFAQTKFGSTKLKSNAKKAAQMTPSEFSVYIKLRAANQQQQNLQKLNTRETWSTSQDFANNAQNYETAMFNQSSNLLIPQGNTNNFLHENNRLFDNNDINSLYGSRLDSPLFSSNFYGNDQHGYRNKETTNDAFENVSENIEKHDSLMTLNCSGRNKSSPLSNTFGIKTDDDKPTSLQEQQLSFINSLFTPLTCSEIQCSNKEINYNRMDDLIWRQQPLICELEADCIDNEITTDAKNASPILHVPIQGQDSTSSTSTIDESSPLLDAQLVQHMLLAS